MSLNKKTFNSGGGTALGGGQIVYTGVGTSGSVSVTTGCEPDALFIFPADENDSNSRTNIVIDKVWGTDVFDSSTGISENHVKAGSSFITWGTDGFTLTGTSNPGLSSSSYKPEETFNQSSRKYIGMAFTSSSTGVTNNDGNTTSTVYYNPDTEFSKVYFTSGGASTTIGHGMSVKPQVMLCLPIPDHSSMSSNTRVNSDSSSSVFDNVNSAYRGFNGGGTFWEPMLSTSSNVCTADTSKITVGGGDSRVGGLNGQRYVIYCWGQKTGFFNNAGYTGNGSSSGRTVNSCGFDPVAAIITSPNDTTAFFIGRANSGSYTFTGFNPSDQSKGANNLEDCQAYQDFGGGSVTLSHGSDQVSTNSSESTVNTSSRLYACFAWGGDLYHYS